MSEKLWEAPSANAYQTTLDGSITDSDTTISLNSVTNLVAPGVLVIDRQDGSGNNTPALREYVSFTGISGSDLTGVTRGLAASTAQAHTSGALVEAVPSVTHWGDLVDYLQSEHDATGKHVISTATIALADTLNLAVSSQASIYQLNVASISAPSIPYWEVGELGVLSNASIENLEVGSMVMSSLASFNELYVRVLNVSGLSVAVNTKGQFIWHKTGALATSLPTTTNLTPFQFHRAHQNMTILNSWVGVQSAPSLSTLDLDVQYASSPTDTWQTIFAVKPTMDIGEYTTDTAAAMASIQLTSLASGTLLRPAIEKPGGAGYMTVQLQVETRA